MSRVIVVGAGLYGLIVAKTYLQVAGVYDDASSNSEKPCLEDVPYPFTVSKEDTFNPTNTDLLIIDSASGLGGTWNHERLYPNLLSQNSYGMYEYSDLPMASVVDRESDDPNGQFITGWKINQYLQAWSEKWDLTKRMRFNWEVASISRLPSKEWKLDIDILSSSPNRPVSVLCDKLVLATGLTSEPNMPSIHGLDWANGSTPHNIHARDVGKYCRNHLAYQPILDKHPHGKEEGVIHIEETHKSQPLRSVAIYGANKSSFDFVHLFATLHRNPSNLHLNIAPSDAVQVHWIIRDQGPGASWMAPPETFLASKEPAPSDQAASTRFMSLLNPCVNDIPKAIKLVRSSNRCGRNIRIEGSWKRRLVHGNPLGRLFLRHIWESSARSLMKDVQYDSNPKMQKLRPATSILDCGSAIGVANHADFWDTFRAPNVHVHRSSITAISEMPAHATIHLSNGNQIESIDLVIHATGWKPVVPVRFEPDSLGVSLGLPCQIALRSHEKNIGAFDYWEGLDTIAESKLRATHRKSITPSMSNPADRETFPYRLYRRMVSPALVAEGDRSFAVMGIVLSSTIAVIAEVQALWVAAFLTGGLDSTTPDNPRPGSKQPLHINSLSRERLDREVSEDVVWGNITGGGLAVDSIHYNDTLMRDLGLNPHRMGGGFWSEMNAVYGPSAYAGIADEWLDIRASQAA